MIYLQVTLNQGQCHTETSKKELDLFSFKHLIPEISKCSTIPLLYIMYIFATDRKIDESIRMLWHRTLNRDPGLGYNTLLLRLIPEDLLSACPHIQFHTLPYLSDILVALSNYYPNASVPSSEAVCTIFIRPSFDRGIMVCRPFVHRAVRLYIHNIVHNSCGQGIPRTIWRRMLKLFLRSKVKFQGHWGFIKNSGTRILVGRI